MPSPPGVYVLLEQPLMRLSSSQIEFAATFFFFLKKMVWLWENLMHACLINISDEFTNEQDQSILVSWSCIWLTYLLPVWMPYFWSEFEQTRNMFLSRSCTNSVMNEIPAYYGDFWMIEENVVIMLHCIRFLVMRWRHWYVNIKW